MTDKILGVKNRFSRNSAPMRRAPTYNPLSATFKKSQGGIAPMLNSIVTLDEALNVIAHRQRGIAAVANRDKDVKKRRQGGAVDPFAILHARNKNPRVQAKVKMPTLSFLKKDDEIDA